MATTDSDISTNYSCSRAKDTDMALGHSSVPDATMALRTSWAQVLAYPTGLHLSLDSNTALLDQHGTSLGHGHRWCPRIQLPTGPSKVTGATYTNTDHHCCFRPTDQDMALGSSPVLDITIAPGVKQTTHISPFPFLTIFVSSDSPLYPAYKPFCLLLFHFPTLYTLRTMVPYSLMS